MHCGPSQAEMALVQWVGEGTFWAALGSGSGFRQGLEERRALEPSLYLRFPSFLSMSPLCRSLMKDLGNLRVSNWFFTPCLFLVDIKMCFNFSIVCNLQKSSKVSKELLYIPHSVSLWEHLIPPSYWSQLVTNIDTVLLNSRIYLNFISFPLTWSRIPSKTHIKSGNHVSFRLSGCDSHTNFSCFWWLWCLGEYSSET